MSDAIQCDSCKDTLVLNDRGDDPNGEIAGWIKLTVTPRVTWDACTRSCATQLLADDGAVHAVLDDWVEVVGNVARTVREDREGEDAEEDGES